MNKQKNLFEYNRTIKLPPAIGDWTTIQYQAPDLDELSISPINNINFDSLPKEQLKYIHYLHYRFAEKMTQKLSQDMDIKVELHSIEVAQMSYEDFLSAQQEKVVQTDLKLANNNRISVLFDWSLAETIINRLVGGRGESQDSEEFSVIEASILETQMQEIKPLFAEAWKVIGPEDISIDFSAGYYVQDKKITLREAYIVFEFNFYFGKNDLKKMVIAYPNTILRGLMLARKNATNKITPRIELDSSIVQTIQVPIKAVLGKAVLPMSGIKYLQIGDIIPLNTTLDAPIHLHMADATTLPVQVGVHNGRRCVQIINSTLAPTKTYLDHPIKVAPQPLFTSAITEAENLLETIDADDDTTHLEYGDQEGETINAEDSAVWDATLK